jgi:hypothetical protein
MCFGKIPTPKEQSDMAVEITQEAGANKKINTMKKHGKRKSNKRTVKRKSNKKTMKKHGKRKSNKKTMKNTRK